MDRCALTTRLGLTLFFVAAACGTGGTHQRDDLLAYGGPGSQGRVALTAPADTATALRVPDSVLRDPQERMTAMLQLRRQIVFKTRGVPHDRYQHEVRPNLARQLRAAGFEPRDVESILSDVDYSRRQRE